MAHGLIEYVVSDVCTSFRLYELLVLRLRISFEEGHLGSGYYRSHVSYLSGRSKCCYCTI